MTSIEGGVETIAAKLEETNAQLEQFHVYLARIGLVLFRADWSGTALDSLNAAAAAISGVQEHVAAAAESIRTGGFAVRDTYTAHSQVGDKDSVMEAGAGGDRTPIPAGDATGTTQEEDPMPDEQTTRGNHLYALLTNGGMSDDLALKATNEAIARGDQRSPQEIAVDVLNSQPANWVHPDRPRARVLHTVFGDLATQHEPMEDLAKGDWVVGPDESTVYEVTSDPEVKGVEVNNPHVWVEVRDLSMADQEADRLLAEPGAVEPGQDPRDGFFTYMQGTKFHRVLELSGSNRR